MKRVIIGALVSTLLIPGLAFGQGKASAVEASKAAKADAAKVEKAEGDDPGAGPAVSEPESSDIAAKPVEKTEGTVVQGLDQTGESYTVKPGDTLWDLSQRFLGNPWYWPKVWSYNPQIENPHWIYPGNLIRFYPGQEEMPAQVADGQQQPAAPVDEEPLQQPPQEMADVSMGNMETPDLMGQDDDVVAVAGPQKIGFVAPKKTLLRQDGFVTQKELDDAGIITRAWAEKDMLSTYDKVYVRFKNQGEVRVGQKFIIYRTTEQVTHPVSGEKFGYLTHVVGSLEVVALDKNVATAVIDSGIDEINRGNFVGPWGSFEKQIISKAATREVKGVILASLVPQMPMFGEQHIIFIDKGKKDGVEEGQIFHVYRRGDPLRSEGPEESARYPKEDIAQVIVIDVTNDAAAAIVVKSIRELVVGDKLETRPEAQHAMK